eukprot:SAG11_NODE_7248_length_1173_cov_1.286778_2_plen_87_part_00
MWCSSPLAIAYRPWSKSEITVVNEPRHLPGYSGHIPGLDAGRGETFGDSTTDQLIDLAASIKASPNAPTMVCALPAECCFNTAHER